MVGLMTDLGRQTDCLAVFSRVGPEQCQRGCHAWCCAGKRSLRKKSGREYTCLRTNTCTQTEQGHEPNICKQSHAHTRKRHLSTFTINTRISLDTDVQNKQTQTKPMQMRPGGSMPCPRCPALLPTSCFQTKPESRLFTRAAKKKKKKSTDDSGFENVYSFYLAT